MPRSHRTPNIPPPDPPKGPTCVPYEEERYDVEVITPIVGGGVVSQTPDPDLPIRPRAIQSQLRWWWRLLHAYGKPHLRGRELFDTEATVWGSASDDDGSATASRIAVLVDMPARLAQDVVGGQPTIESMEEKYALWALKGKNLLPVPLPDGSEFSFGLALRLDKRLSNDAKQDVREAFRWWACFGGIGARTRRGCGAVVVRTHPEGRLLKPVSAAEVGALGGRLATAAACGSAREAWQFAIGRLRDFRQYRMGPGSRGKSVWPEAAAIRAIAHHADGVPLHFPRAALGLPMEMQFRNEPTPTHHVRPELMDGRRRRVAERLASPLILRPRAEQKEEALVLVPCALLLPRQPGSRRSFGLRVSEGKKQDDPGHRTEISVEAGKWWPEHVELPEGIRDFADARDPADPLLAFLRFFAGDADRTRQRKPTSGPQGRPGNDDYIWVRGAKVRKKPPR